MNNIDLIKEDYKIGDTIRLSCSLGVKEGIIVAFLDNRIKIQPYDKSQKPFSLLDTSITDWEEGENTSLTQEKSENSNENQQHQENQVNIASVSANNSKEDSEQSVPSDNFTPTCTTLTDNGIAYKPGDVVPKEILDNWKKEKKRQAKKKIINEAKETSKGKPQTFKSLSDLASLESVKESHEADAKSIVREMGIISSCGYSEFGFINDFKTGGRLWFSFSELIDLSRDPNELKGQYVVFSRSQNYQGAIAVSIHKPDTIENIVKLANQIFEKGEKSSAYELINHILFEYPDSFLANQALQSFRKKKKVIPLKKSLETNDYKYYKEARDYNDQKDYDNAIKSYLKAIQKKQKVESAIKDLGMLYISLSKKSEETQTKEDYLKDASSLMKTYGHMLSKNNVNMSYLENFYYAVRDFDNFKIIAQQLLLSLNVHTDGPRYVFLLNKLAAVFIKEGNTKEARRLLNQALEIYPEGAGATKLLDIIDAPTSINIDERIDEEIDSLDVNNLDTFTEGLTLFIEQTLSKYEEYAGVKEKERGNFTSKTLSGVRSLIETFDERKFSGMPTERARYLLTEGKLMQQLEPEKTFELRSVMARYCNDMAKIHIFNSSSIDIIRFYYLEAFALEENYRATAQQVSYYLLTNLFENKKLSEEIKKSISVDNALKMVFEGGFDQKKWENILNVLLYNKEICAQIVSKLYENIDYRKHSLAALKEFGVELNEISSKEDFLKAWNRAREKRIGELRRIKASMRSLANTSNIEELSIRLSENMRECRQEWMCSLDLSRITQIITQIAPALDKFHKASGFRNKQLNCHETENLLTQMIDEITKGPTKLSYEAILPLLEQALKTVNEAFENILVASKPTPKISLLRTETVVDQKQVPLQIEISIDKDSSPIYNVSIEIISNDEIQAINADDSYSYLGLIEGGDTHIFKPIVKVSDYVLEKKAVAFEVKCHYHNAGEEKVIDTSLSLHLYNPEDFTLIENPYAAVAESGPLSADSKMFYGQRDYIQSVVDTIIESPSKQVIIYGQKRSGKSSVLNKVQQELSSAGAFCVQFSMGKIVRNISEYAFYHKILSEIQFSLESLKEEGDIVPDFKIPSRMEFQNEDPDNPAETFTRYMRNFKSSCKKTLGWEDRRLVVLIDEFTYMYGAIKMHKISPTIMMQWKAITQDEFAQFSVVLVGQDVIPAFKNEPYARNAFGVIKDLRLSYLKEDEAKDLIVNPIRDNGNSRYNEKAVSLIMDYTACNPYYIQIFCSYLVNYMNKKHYNSVTEADVQDVVEELITGVNALDSAKFENLLSSGETDNEEDVLGTEVDNAIKTYSDSDVEIVLKAVAKASSNKVWAARTDISTSLPYEIETGILKQLKAREVLDDKDDQSYYKIKVRLYKEWLLKH